MRAKVKLENFLNSKLYPLAMIIITFLFWVFQDKNSTTIQTLTIVAFSFYIVLITLFLIFFKDNLYMMFTAMCALFVIGVSHYSALNVTFFEKYPFIYLLIIIIVIAFVYHIIKYKVKLKMHALGLSFVFIAIGYIAALRLNSNALNNLGTYIIQTLVGPVYLFLYLFFVNTIEKKSLKIFMYMFFMICLLVTAQFLAEYLRLTIYSLRHVEGISNVFDAIKLGIKSKWEIGGQRIELGYDNVNGAAMYIGFLLPTTVYLAYKSKQKLLYFAAFITCAVAGLLSLSRGAYISIGISSFLSVVLVLIYFDKNSKILLISGLAAISIIILIIPGLISSVVDRFIFMATKDDGDIWNGRLILYEMAVQQFERNPLFGSGFFGAIDSPVTIANRAVVYHSTFFHAVGTMGYFGLGALIYHLSKVALLIKKKVSLPVLFLLIGILATHVHGLIDNTFYMFIYMFITIIIYVAIEKGTKVESDNPIFNKEYHMETAEDNLNYKLS